ncbi:hypothetical protein WJ45_20120 [Burkholderia ubonensis]|nr:hypothetical protein WJ45_20120 [Burkholderia ubonensis]KVQ44352.1 hypothetical protein WK04_15625 [Burkholderia ubonensis]
MKTPRGCFIGKLLTSWLKVTGTDEMGKPISDDVWTTSFCHRLPGVMKAGPIAASRSQLHDFGSDKFGAVVRAIERVLSAQQQPSAEQFSSMNF